MTATVNTTVSPTPSAYNTRDALAPICTPAPTSRNSDACS